MILRPPTGLRSFFNAPALPASEARLVPQRSDCDRDSKRIPHVLRKQVWRKGKFSRPDVRCAAEAVRTRIMPAVQTN